MRLRTLPAVLAALSITVTPALGQDVELLSRIHGTPLPPGYLAWRTRNPDAFQFAHGRAARMRLRMQSFGGSPMLRQAPLAVIGPREGAVTGNFRIPMVLGLFSDSPEGTVPVPVDQFRTAYFGDGPTTVSAFYAEVSGGRVTLDGDVQDWVRSNISQADAAGGTSGLLPPARVGDFIVGLLDQLPAIDWGQYDDDGPDGVPNSGDDDGFVDALAVIQPTSGAECGGTNKNEIWSHKWSLRSATSGRAPYTTTTAAAGGGFIRIDDYFIQPAISCSGSGINEIGVFTHEAGHAFGLPDLYDTRSSGTHNGDGNWELMATGAYGCNGHSPASPCHMGAWSKSVLGWADVTTLAPDADLGSLILPPVERTGVVYRLDAGDGTGTFFLLENRQRIGFDQNLLGTGLLVWQVDPTLLAARWPANTVNANSQMAVWIRQADGRNDLGTVGGGRGDSGDPFPYENISPGNHVFHATSNPASRSLGGSATGVTLLDIQHLGEDVSFRALTRFTQITVRSEGDSGAGGLFAVDGLAIEGTTHTFGSAPFEFHEVAAAAGETLGEGRRSPFIRWVDDPEAPRVRAVETPLDDIVLTAEYAGEQVELTMDVTGGVNGIGPATFETDPPSQDLWFPPGTTVTIEAVPQTGFGFLRWTGALAGQSNPAVLTIENPVAAGADFELIYRVPAQTVPILAGTEQSRMLEPENGTAPFIWSVLGGVLAKGLRLDATGHLTGAALETGVFDLHVRVRDAIGLSAEGDLRLEIDAPTFPADRLGGPFLLNGATLTSAEMSFLDQQGNKNGSYDLGDFRAWVLAHPGLPLTGAMRALMEGKR